LFELKKIVDVVQEIASSEPGIEIDEEGSISNEIGPSLRDDRETEG
jgi:hypothetical protein